MQLVYLALWCVGLWPLLRAWWSNRRTSLLHALNWVGAAWVAWGIALVFMAPLQSGMEPGRYLALCFSGAAGVAFLGARFPQVGAWNFVVLGLLAVLVLPLLENRILGMPVLGPLRIIFLAATLAVAVLNYLPTRFWPAAALWTLACAGEMTLLFASKPDLVRSAPALHLLCLAIPWAAFICERTRAKPTAQFDAMWREFRDHWGLFWAQRVREQFNRSAHHAGWPVHLYWQGLALLQTGLPSETTQDEIIATLKALLKRFRGEDHA
ncbi:MAG: hypothetical protein HY040_17775 [Planctomycetes bacterium]|nr:hypothetical protein [Planctomycetota bacterium]